MVDDLGDHTTSYYKEMTAHLIYIVPSEQAKQVIY